jgi:CubicO group peptidase (beta-lactamase class C family)
MLSRLLAVSATLFLSTASVSASTNNLDAILARSMDGTHTPALAMLEMHDGKITGEAVHGVRRNDRPDPATVTDVWATGSDCKPMTAALIARLVDRGVLSWDAPLSKMLPELADAMRPEYRKVTLIQLLSHHAGLPHDTSDTAFFASFFTDTRPLPQQRLAYIGKALKEAPAVAPGSAFSYSNTGFIVAAAIAERATGSSYEELMQREIFKPLGMTSARFAATHDGQPLGHRHGKPATAAYLTADDGNPLMLAPAGGELHLSLRDWAKFCLDQMAGFQGHGKLLTPASYHLMQTNRSDDQSAVGWGVQDSIGGRKGPVLVHAGSDGNWYAVVALFPKTGNGVMVAANAADDMDGDKAVKAAVGALLPDLSPAK